MKYLSDAELRALDAKEIKGYCKELKTAKFLGMIMYPYGDENYFKLEDGTVVKTYTKIGD